MEEMRLVFKSKYEFEQWEGSKQMAVLEFPVFESYDARIEKVNCELNPIWQEECFWLRPCWKELTF